MLSSLPQLSTHDAYTLWYTTNSNTTPHLDQQQLQGPHGPVPTDPPPFHHPHRRPAHSTLVNITNTPHHSSHRSTAEVLFSLRQSEAFIAQRKLNIQRFGASWIRPPGVAKTYQAAMDEAIEREEQERLLERAGEEMEIVEIVGAQGEGVQGGAGGQGQGQGEGQVGEGGVQERDLDEEIPDADDVDDEEEDEDDDELDDEDDDDDYETEDDDEGLMVEVEDPDPHAEAERDLDDDIPEGGSYQHTDTDISIPDDDDEDEGPMNNQPDEPDVVPTLTLASSSSSVRGRRAAMTTTTTTTTVRTGVTASMRRRTLQTSTATGSPPRRRRGITFTLDERVTRTTGTGEGLNTEGRDSTAHLVGSVIEEDSSGMTSMMEDSLLGRGRGGRRRGG